MIRQFLVKRNIKSLKRRLHSVGLGVDFDGSLQCVYPERISIGNYVYLGPGTYLNGRGGLEIQDHCILAPDIVVLTAMHNYKNAELVPYDAVELLRPVVIEECVWIGMRAIIMPGVRIGEGSIIGAGSVVTKSCEPCTILGGNPARVIGHRDSEHYYTCKKNGQFYLMHKQNFKLNKIELPDS